MSQSYAHAETSARTCEPCGQPFELPPGLRGRADQTRAGCVECRETLRKCPKCRTWKTRDKFAKQSWCKVCRSERHAGLTEEQRRAIRNRQYQKTYGVTLEWFEEQERKQGGLCAICGRPDSRRELCVDHDHETGGVRGLLCLLCNVFLGQISDNVEVLRAAIDYLEKHGSVVGSRGNVG